MVFEDSDPKNVDSELQWYAGALARARGFAAKIDPDLRVTVGTRPAYGETKRDTEQRERVFIFSHPNNPSYTATLRIDKENQSDAYLERQLEKSIQRLYLDSGGSQITH